MRACCQKSGAFVYASVCKIWNFRYAFVFKDLAHVLRAQILSELCHSCLRFADLEFDRL